MVTEDGSQRLLLLNWVEAGVHRASVAPVKEGFGTRLIKNGVAYDLQGTCDYQLTENGMVCRLSVPF